MNLTRTEGYPPGALEEIARLSVPKWKQRLLYCLGMVALPWWPPLYFTHYPAWRERELYLRRKMLADLVREYGLPAPMAHEPGQWAVFDLGPDLRLAYWPSTSPLQDGNESWALFRREDPEWREAGALLISGWHMGRRDTDNFNAVLAAIRASLHE
jgi:hypothetical protein